MLKHQNCLDRFITTFFVGYAFVCIALIIGNFKTAYGYPTVGLNMFSSHKTDLEDKMSLGGRFAQAEISFQQLIHSKPDPTIIGEIKPNSSEQDLMLLKNKIASTILSMQEMNKASGHQVSEPPGADCIIEVTRVERVAGKCRKVSNGLPTCQSDNYVAINSECN